MPIETPLENTSLELLPHFLTIQTFHQNEAAVSFKGAIGNDVYFS